MLVALIAYERLDDAARNRIVSILKTHPKFDESFRDQMPLKVRASDSRIQDKWIFIHASTWPDIARGYEGEDELKYHRATWHYINQPFYLSRRDRDALRDSIPANLGRQWRAGMRNDAMNVIQALQKSQVRLSKTQVSDREKAVYLCWLFHLVGDLHQPMHASSLFSPHRFPEGDRGGNSIPIKDRGNLHAVWDGLLGHSTSLGVLGRVARVALRDDELRQLGERSAGSLDFEDWTSESHTAAWEFAYDEAIIAEVAGKESSNEHLDPIKLPRDYYQVAQEVATERAVQAGFRLAKLVGTLEL